MRTAWANLPAKARFGVVIIAVFAFLAVFGPTLAPYNYSATQPAATGPTGPSAAHWFGTTAFGQDVF
ncbi:MAG TPA: hypothetical protein VED59_08325, partial [Acidimicrobiales bacterium]|nr:hypothetical protein [Acidimicrobiales bacterium]